MPARTHIHRAILCAMLAPLTLPAFAAQINPDQSHAYAYKHPSLEDAHLALEQGRADDALAILRPITQQDPRNAPAQDLLCRTLDSLQRYDDAVPACERAVAAAPGNALFQLSLAHALGSKAQHGSPFTALPVARRAHDHFETAARLAPTNWSVLSDLGEYDAEAPGIAGGGISQARRVQAELMPLNASRGHWLAARIAEETRDYATAEEEYKAAISTGLLLPEAYVNLATFYRRHNRYDEAVELIRKAEAADKERDPVLVDAATLLIDMHRDNKLAIHLLREYLNSPNRTEDAPAFAVLTQIGNILESEGDQTAANKEFNAALKLAHDYAPALKAQRQQ